MTKTTFDTHLQTFSENRFLILLVLILLTIVLTPFLDDFIETRILMDFFLTAIFIALIFAIRSRRSHVIVASILVLPLVLTTWLPYFFESIHVGLLARIFGALFFGYTVIIILQTIARSTEIRRETIFAAIVAYLLIALMWAFFYLILELMIPGSFNVPGQDIRTETMRFEYFSFITITTLGYGDVTPLSNRASALALLEALIGQIYLVVLVAWLVGMYVSRKVR
jgi:hypothetical protein